ncbi:salicylate synthase [Aquaspirillum sp. LM1]|uniref:salicylate synthase n=1 Tax=Aquaspirillum sp. LM1 TaxID=1938604 RepID=UPI0009840798|nr:salicylate synthase [Aquaspirillum sp. LM1]AQR65658.1 salicylate synthase [Aquaspirillum sp. LM1]
MDEYAFIPFPPEHVQRYQQAGYWQQQTLGQQLRDWASRFASRIAVVDGEQRISYQALDQQVDRLSASLHALGITQGDRVLVQLPNSLAFVSVCFALFRLGAWPILAMPSQRSHDIQALCHLAEPVAYIAPTRFLGFDYRPLADEVSAQHPAVQVFLLDAGLDPFSCFAPAPPAAADWPEPDPFSPALLLLSGGTTGTPKLIPRTHADYLYNAQTMAQCSGVNSQTVYLAALPVAHNFPLSCPGLLGVWQAGGCVVMARTPGFDETFPLIARERVTLTALVPPLVQLWVSAREWDNSDLSSLEVLQVGGSRLDRGLAAAITPALGCQLQQVFGMAEGLICCTRLNDPLQQVLHTQGRAISPLDEVRIVDPDTGLPVQEGECGELQVRGPYTIQGYYRAAAHNALSFTADGFYRSGDWVWRTPEGNLVVEGRIKEQINRAGEKIASAEVEDALSGYPGMSQCTLVGVADDSLGERSCLCMIADGEPPSLGEIQHALQAKGFPRYKQPDQLLCVRSWPLTSVGKIDKRQLAQWATQAYAQPQGTPPGYHEIDCPIDSDVWSLATQLASTTMANTYVLYEQGDTCLLALDTAATLTALPDVVMYQQAGESWRYPGPPSPEQLHAVCQRIPLRDWRLYGLGQFELAHLFHQTGVALDPMQPLLQLFIPQHELRISPGSVLIRSLDADALPMLQQWVQRSQTTLRNPQDTAVSPLVLAEVSSQNAEHYQQQVAKAVADIQAGNYQKIILSRQVSVPVPVDLPASYRLGRQHNTPARSFLVQLPSVQLLGFSPETVVEVSAQRQVSTQPLAGTRSLGRDAQHEAELRKELLNDTKEIAEHAVSVKLACEELGSICIEGSVHVPQFMQVLRRGSVQHLASRVHGQLRDELSAWHAFAALFPAVTASGIPKQPSLRAIAQYEGQPRGAYSGCIMHLDANGTLDAALVLRSLYQQNGHCWLQAGAGIVDQSRPARELEETIEKLSCIARYLVARPTHHAAGSDFSCEISTCQ